MNRRDLNRHMHSHHRAAEPEYLLASVGDGKVSVHEMAHAEGIITHPHTHDDDEDTPSESKPKDDKSERRILNQHMHWQHGGEHRDKHRDIHDSLLADHDHDWPLSLVALGEMVDEAKAAQMQVHSERTAKRNRVMRTHKEQGTS